MGDAGRKTTATTSTTRLQGKLLAFEFINASERFGKTGCRGREITSTTKRAEWIARIHVQAYLSIVGLSLDHEFIKTHVESLECRTIERILLPARAHYLIIMLMTIVWLKRADVSTDKGASEDRVYSWHSITSQYCLKCFIVRHARVRIRAVSDQFEEENAEAPDV